MFLPSITTSRDTRQRFTVWPNDIDAFGHMNNGRYLQIMDVARFRWLLLTGTIATIRRRRWSVLLGGNLIRYRRPPRLWSRYHVTTKLLCWDTQWFFLEHSFTDHAGRPLAVAISRAAFRGQGAWVDTQTVMDAVDNGRKSPPVPDFICNWMEAETSAFSNAQKQVVAG